MAEGWNPQKVAAFREAFFEFLDYVWVNSKELGRFRLGGALYRAQLRFFDGVFDALSHDIHDIKHLKSRQLGVSTASRALTLFWVGVHAGLKGYMVFDTADHKEEARIELISMIEGLPAKLKFPKIKRQNRSLVELSNGSMINFASAGVKTAKGSGTLGRSSGINFVHASEMCSWDNTEGVEAFKNALAEDFPDRLYIWESTARGPNIWKEMWDEARKDPAHQYCIFSGWWAKDNQRVPIDSVDFLRYGEQAPSDEEIAKIRKVKELYDWDVTPEQLAWIRRKMDPTAEAEGDAPADFSGNPLRIQEQPWDEEEAWQITGSVFFAPEDLTVQMHKFTSPKFKTYSYSYGTEFVHCKVFPAINARSVELKVWEEPDEDGVYVVASDPAFGANEHNDRSAIQVLRCYADGVDQVAEYAWPLINTRAFAWVIASLCGWYGGEKAEVYNILELNGPGEAVWQELQKLKFEVQQSYGVRDIEEKGLRRIFYNVRNYVYTRSDSMSAGRVYQWKTTPRLKVSVMERLRDFLSNGTLRIRSIETLEEMRSVTREGDSIEAQGTKKDDRVLAMAFGVRCWEERCRRTLYSAKRTRDSEAAKKRLSIVDQAHLYNKSHLENFFAVKARARNIQLAQQRRMAWRGR